jgi:molecular chaperone GrpE
VSSGRGKFDDSEPGDGAGQGSGPGGPKLPENPELEAALREAVESVESHEKSAEAADDTAAELEKAQDRLVRLQADFENFRRRALSERHDLYQYGAENLVKDLLLTVDNLDRAIGHARESGGGDLESLLRGVELVQRELMAALTKHGVVRIEAEGQPFDPAVHEAMAQAPDDSVAPNTVIEEMQTGYKLRDRLLRPARVIVAAVAKPESPSDEPVQPTEAAGETD